VLSEETTYPTDSLPLATIPRRLVGWAIDYLLFGVPFSLVTVALNTSSDASTIAEPPLWATFGFAAASAVYQTVFVATRGRTLGAWIMGVRIVRIDDGQVPGWSKAGIRALVPMIAQAVPVVGLFVMAAIYMTALFNPRRQGLHDRAAGTIVVTVTR
jgi:uncharacterized RDD family membrane protein YckC